MTDSTPYRVGEWLESVYEDKLISLLQEEKPDVVVIEDFVFRPGFKEGKWKTTEVSKLIGVTRLAAKMHNCEYIEQAPAIKPVGYGMAGMKYVKGKRGTHRQDAVAHGVYYYRTKGRLVGEVAEG